MKKVFIGCAAVLLSLGLLAGCDSEEGDKAVSIKVDNAATVVVGNTLELPYTVDPEKAKIEVLNDYKEYVTAEAEDGVLSLTGVAEGSATVTLVGTYKKYTEANVNISVSVITKEEEDTGPEPVPTPDTPTVSFSLSQTSCDLTVDETIEIEYTLDPSNATVVATSGNDNYVTAEVGTGVISLTGKSEGTTTVSVTASYEGYISATETISVSVTQGTVAVTGVVIDQGSELTLAANATTTLTATVTPANATNPSVEWAVTGTEGVITLDTATGEVTAGSESGSTTVTVTTVDGNYTDSIAITVEKDVVPEITSIAFDSTKSYSVEKGETLDVANDVVATWKDNVTGDTPVYEFSMTENEYASLSESVITGVASTYGLGAEALPVVTASIQGDTNVSPTSQTITVTEKATLTGISFNEQLPTSVNAGATIDLSQCISITGTGDDWKSLVDNATVTYELGNTSVATITNSTVTINADITADDSITVTAKLADYTDATSATATISVVAPLTIVSATFKEQSYELTVGTEMDFADEIEVTYNKTDSGSIEYSVELSCSDVNVTISEDKHSVTATGSVESATLTATITWSGGSTTCTTSISAEPEPITGVTLSITLKYQGSTVTSIPEYEDLYILGTWKDANLSSLENAELLTQGEGCVFTLQLSESLEVGEWYNYKIYAAYTEESGQETTLEWGHCLYSSGQGYFQVANETTSGSTLNLVAEIEVDPATILGDPSVGPFTNYTINFYFTDGGSTYYTLPDYADAYLTGDFTGSTWTYGETNKLTAGTDETGNTYYSYTFSEIEAGAHTLAIYFEYNSSAPEGAQGNIPSWQHQYSSNFEYVVESSATSSTSYDYTIAGGDPAEAIPAYDVPEDDPDTFDITIVTKNTGSNQSSLSALYITGGDASGSYWDYHYTMSGTSGTDYSSMGEFYYTFAGWNKQTNLEFCLHHKSGNDYYNSDIIPSTNVTATDGNYQFWTWDNGSSNTSYMGFSLSNQDRMSLVGIDELILVLSFDYSAINTTSGHNNSLAMTYSVTAVSTAN